MNTCDTIVTNSSASTHDVDLNSGIVHTMIDLPLSKLSTIILFFSDGGVSPYQLEARHLQEEEILKTVENLPVFNVAVHNFKFYVHLLKK